MRRLLRASQHRRLVAVVTGASLAYLLVLIAASHLGFSLGLAESVLSGHGIPMTADYAADPSLPVPRPLTQSAGVQALIDAGVRPKLAPTTSPADQTVASPEVAISPLTLAPAPTSVRPASANRPATAMPQSRGALIGAITSGLTHRAISGASVTVRGVGEAIADSQGQYRIRGLVPKQTYPVDCAASGYQSQSTQVTADRNGNAWLNIQMVPSLGA